MKKRKSSHNNSHKNDADHHLLLTGIPGRKTAEQIEDEHMAAFEEKYGRLPRGNKSKNRKSR